MRLFSLFAAACCGFHAFSALAIPFSQSEPGEPASELRYEVAESSGHYNVLVARETLVDPETGETNAVDHKIIHLGSGLNFFDDATQTWQPSVAQFELNDQGVAATRVFHQVRLAGDPTQRGAVRVSTPDGVQLSSHVVGLALFDPATGDSLLIAELKPKLQGQLLLPDKTRLLFADAFDSVKADLVYDLRQESFAQDIILHEQVDPAAWKFPAGSYVEIWTEFDQNPEPVRQTHILNALPDNSERPAGSQPERIDETLAFGELLFGPGVAMREDQTGGPRLTGGREGTALVTKRFLKLDGRQFLIESLAAADLAPLTKDFPAPADKKQARHETTRNGRTFAEALPKSNTGEPAKPIQIAQLEQGRSGVVLDYTILASASSLTLTTGTTYFITNTVSVSTLLTIEGGAIVKYSTNASASITVNGAITCLTAPTRVSVFTSINDNTVGEVITGSTGSPATNSCGNPSLYINIDNTDLHDIRISYAQTAVRSGAAYQGNQVRDSQITASGNAIRADGFADVDGEIDVNYHLRNVLMYNVGTNMAGSMFNLYAFHVTVDKAAAFCPGWSSGHGVVSLTNCLLVDLPDPGSLSSRVASPLFSSGASVFQTNGAGEHYQQTSLTNRGSTNGLQASIISNLQQRTVFPPNLLTNTVNVDTVLSTNVLRDTTSSVRLGYHYWPIDYVASNVTVTATLTLTNGVVLGVHGNYGLSLQSGSKLLSEGTPLNLNQLLHSHAIQEKPSIAGISFTGLLTIPSAAATRPILRLRFTDVASGGPGSNAKTLLSVPTYYPGEISLTDCQLHGIFLYLSPQTGGTGLGVLTAFTNNLFERCTVQLYKSYYSYDVNMTVNCYNNLFIGGVLSFLYDTHTTYNPAWSIKDNHFDTVNLGEGGSGASTYISNGYNAYQSTTSLGGSGNITLTNFPYATGTLGRWYQGATNLANLGSRNATNAGLFWYTTTTNQAIETNTVVDIGFHFVALNSNGQPIDTDSDGIPSYAEDLNGNGITNAGELDFNDSDTDYDGRRDGDELLDGTDPRDPSSVKKVMLASWKFDTSAFVGEQGQTPDLSAAASLVANWSSGAASFAVGANYLAYKDVETNGFPNFNARNGTLRFWYKPNSTALAGTVHLVAMGNSGDLWVLQRYNPDGKIALLTQGPTMGTNLQVSYFGINEQVRPIAWGGDKWWQITLTYSPTNVTLYTNGIVAEITNPDQRAIDLTPGVVDHRFPIPSGLFHYPAKAARATGFRIGFLGEAQFDELQTYNYPMTPQEVAAGFPYFPGVANPMTDTDYDGRSDLVEDYVDHTDKTNPNDALRTRLGYFRFNTPDLKGEQGQLPVLNAYCTLSNSWSGSSLAWGGVLNSRVIYRDVETNGWCNFNCRKGAVRFWVKPAWSAGGPGYVTPFLFMGNSTDSWSLQLNSTATQINQVCMSGGVSTTVLSGSVTFTNTAWHQIALNYDSTATKLYFDGALVATSSGLPSYPALALRNVGLVIGNYTWATGPMPAQFEELETFNYALTAQEILDSFEALHGLDNDLNGVLDLTEEPHLTNNLPYLDQPWVVTGVIEAEQFDKGGPGVAYTNTAVNLTSDYRVSGMCITNCNDMGGGYCVDKLKAGDWMKWTLDVRVAGTYAVEPRVSAASTGGVYTVEFYIPGSTNKVAYTTNNFTLLTTNWQNQTFKMVSLPAGSVTMQVKCMTNAADGFVGRLNYISLYPAWDETFPTITTTITPTGLVSNNDSFATALSNAQAIQAAIDSLPATTNGGQVLLPAGTYCIAQPFPTDTERPYRTNFAIGIGRNNTKILGQGKTNTLLVAHNRSATIFMLGYKSPTAAISSPCTNTIISDIGFVGRPHSVYTNMAGVKTNLTEAGALLDIGMEQGTLVCYQGGANTTTLNSVHRLENCRFSSGDRFVGLLNTKNILIRSNEFVHLDDTNTYTFSTNLINATTRHAPDPGVSIVGPASYLHNVVVTENSFNGSARLTNFVWRVTYAEDGFVSFQMGGNWFFARNVLTNNNLEAFNVNSGPSAFVQNSVATPVSYGSTCGFYTAPVQSSWPSVTTNAADQFYSMVGNTVSGGRVGDLAINYLGGVLNLPIRINFSGNQLTLLPCAEVSGDYPGAAIVSSWTDWLNASANTLVTGGYGVRMIGQYTNIYVIKNDFGGTTFRGVVFDGDVGSQRKAVIYNNILNQGIGYHFKSSQADAWSTFVLTNQYKNGPTNVPIFIDPPAATYHFPR